MTEDDFLAALFQRLGRAPGAVAVPPGDDCAALDVGGGRWLLLAVDQLVGDRHYYHSGPHRTPARLAGRKLLARNLSDIAAMGGKPLYCLVAGAFGPDCDEAWLRAFYDGIVALAAAFGVAMIGGDLASTPADTVTSLTIVGEVEGTRVLRRSGARDGDDLWATGCFGSSLPTEHHLHFEPRCREGAWLARTGLAHAMIDVSDGLLIDASRLCRHSAVGCVLEPERVPRRTAATSIEQALSDGEDYELLFAAAPGNAAALTAQWPFAVPLTRIGRFVAGEPLVHTADGSGLPGAGFDHFRDRTSAPT